jgi:RNA polymerase sigma-70 factor (ECF subfamily)
MSPSAPDPHRKQHFAALYDSAYVDVLRFVRRRSSPDIAEDITHEAFLVAWRRIDDVPNTVDGARAWLFGVARNCLLSNHRARARYEQFGVQIAAVTMPQQDPSTEGASVRLDLARAWNRLSTSQQEVLALATWEELPAADAGKVLGISAAAYRIRLHRARTVLRRDLDAAPSPTPLLKPTAATEITA